MVFHSPSPVSCNAVILEACRGSTVVILEISRIVFDFIEHRIFETVPESNIGTS